MSDAADLVFAGIARQAALVRSGQISSRELVEACLGRIARLDPALNAFRVVLGERASAEAEQADARRGAGDERPLPGVPVAVKDVADVAGETTTHGTGAHGPAADRDSELVRRLRAAGAIIVGKTHTPELALAGMVGAATASDGSARSAFPRPAWLFGLNPQRGRVPLAPDDDHWHGLSVAGVLTRSVLDIAAVPAGFDRDRLPLSVQFVGRPNDEATLLSLAAQVEAERPWADRRPPVS